MTPSIDTLEELLQANGGYYNADDVLKMLSTGQMQGFVQGNSWAITQVCQYPRLRALNVVAFIGAREDAEAMEADIVKFARELNCTRLTAEGRAGWIKAKNPGWEVAGNVYEKDLRDA